MSAQPRDRWIPWYFIAFFAVIALVDGVMVTLAVRTQTGTVSEHPYEQGLAYNRVVTAEAEQRALGWSGALAFHENALTFTLHDRVGAPVPLETVTARFTRPTQAGMDFSAPLTRADGGKWRAEVTPPSPGLWEARVFAQSSDGTRYQQAARIVVPSAQGAGAP